MRRSAQLATTALALVVVFAAPAAAQECVGLSRETKGYFSYGFEGTDGATGQGFALGLRVGSSSVHLQRRSLEPVSLIDDMQTVQGVVAVPLKTSLPLCVTGGLTWTGYDDDRANVFGQDEEGNAIQRATAAGPYLRLQTPAGVSLGRELRVSRKIAVGGFVNPSLVYEYERYESFNGNTMKRHGVGLGITTGVSASYGRFMLRSILSSLSSHNYTLNGYNNFPVLSVQLGVRF
jgi:hypothetical protein